MHSIVCVCMCMCVSGCILYILVHSAIHSIVWQAAEARVILLGCSSLDSYGREHAVQQSGSCGTVAAKTEWASSHDHTKSSMHTQLERERGRERETLMLFVSFCL